MTFEELFSIIEERKNKRSKNSYVASLFRGQKDNMIQKIGEESTEVIIAAKNNNREKLISEITDLYFRIIILMVAKDITFQDVEAELEKRNTKK